MRFLEIIGGWINRHFSHEEAIYLVVFLTFCFFLLTLLGRVLAPVLTGLVIAFLLQGLVNRLRRLGLPEAAAVHTTFLLFLGGLVALIFYLLPLIWRQSMMLVNTLPYMLEELLDVIRKLPERYPKLVGEQQADAWVQMLSGELRGLSRALLEAMVGKVPSVLGLVIYLVLVPLSVFFFLKDKARLLAMLTSLLPAQRPLLDRVGAEMNMQLANYVRGKFIEIVIVGAITYVAFVILGLNYAALLAVLVGFSVLIPFIGAAVVTLPIALVGYLQWGWSPEFATLMVTYLVIQALDGNVLVPLLFSEAVDLHPVVIIVAVLAFGGLWGFWGVFFAIPLATLVKAVFNAWPRAGEMAALQIAAEPLMAPDAAPKALE